MISTPESKLTRNATARGTGPVRTSPGAILLALAAAAALLGPSRPAVAGMLNSAPIVDSVTVSPSPVPAGATATITCSGRDLDGTVRRMRIAVSGGSLPGGVAAMYLPIVAGPSVTGAVAWSTPAAGSYTVTCSVSDDGGAWGYVLAGRLVLPVTVVAAASRPPVIDSLTASESEVFPGATVQLSAGASDPDGDPVTYGWSAAAGTLSGSGPTVSWTAPEGPGSYAIELLASDPTGQAGAATVLVQVVWARAGQPVSGGVAGSFYPERVAVDAGGNVYVSEPRARQVVAFTPLGRRLRTVPIEGRPAGIAVDATGTLYVGDGEHGRVLVIDPLGFVVRELGTGAGELGFPLDLAIDRATGRIFVADGVSRSVKRYEPDGQLSLELSLLDGSPAGIEVGPGGELYVADSSRGRVQLFGPAGEELGFIGSLGSQPGELTTPTSVALGPAGDLYVVDSFQSRVSVFRGGLFLTRFGGYGAAAGGLDVPIDLAFDGSSRAVITNSNNARLELFGLAESGVPSCAGDLDCDGLPDAYELQFGLDPLDPGDAWTDLDGDGLVNLQEYLHHTNPRDADTDDDGAGDLDELREGFDPLDPTDHGLLARAGDDLETGPARISLDGSGSRDGAGDPATYRWTQLEGPEEVELRDASGSSPWFVGRLPGDHVFRLQVGDGVELGPRDDTVRVRVLDVPPTADAGPDVGATTGDEVRLDGTLSQDAGGQPLTFTWAQLEGPPVVLAGERTALASFVPAATGAYSFELTVNDGALTSSDLLRVVVDARNDRVPVAEGPGLLWSSVLETTVLDGSRSADADGAPLAYAWRQLRGPSVLLALAETARASFVPEEPGEYVFELSVSDGAHASAPLEVRVVVNDGLTALVAGTRPDRRVAVLDEVDLSCGDGGVMLTCSVRQLEGVRVELVSDAGGATFFPLQAGTHVFELAGADAGGPVSLERQTIVVDDPAGNRVPDAVASTGREELFAGRPVTLLGQSSSDDGSRAGLGYTWTQVSGPRVLLTHPYLRVATGILPLAGRYAFELRVQDGSSRSPPARVELVASEHAGREPR